MNNFQVAIKGKGFVHRIDENEKDEISKEGISLYGQLLKQLTPQALQIIWDNGYYVEIGEEKNNPSFTIKSRNEKAS